MLSYYWFSGKRLLYRPVDDMLEDPASDMPFCLSWANENWTRRWDGSGNEILIAQTYRPEDHVNFIKSLVPFFEDKRYIRLDGAPILLVYKPQKIPDPSRAVEIWREYCLKNGIGKIHLCAALTSSNMDYKQFDFDSGVEFPPHNLGGIDTVNERVSFYEDFQGWLFEYDDVAGLCLERRYENGNVFRTVLPSWDNTARAGSLSLVILSATPDKYEYWLSQAIRRTGEDFPGRDRFVFINAWNEWAEGCHLEPDRRYGRQFLEATLRAKAVASNGLYCEAVTHPHDHGRLSEKSCSPGCASLNAGSREERGFGRWAGAGLQEEHACAGTSEAEIESHREGLSSRTTAFGFRLRRFLAQNISWKNYDYAYQVWKECKRENIERQHHTLKIIADKYSVCLFFLLYPLYKTAKPFLKLTRKLLERKRNRSLSVTVHQGVSSDKRRQRLLPKKRADEMALIVRPPARTFDPSRRTMLLVSHDAFQAGAQIIAFNLLEKFAARYNVISVLLGPGALENAFRNVSVVTIGPFPEELRLSGHIHKPILNACRKFAPAFAIVNSIESREALIPLSKAGVPSVLLVHEFVSYFTPQDMPKVAASAGQMVFPARRVWEDAVAAFPPLARRPANIITPGPTRIPREWLDGDTADNEKKRIAEVMRPLGADDNRVVVMGCGTVDLRKGVDLFISVAAALQKRLPSRRFRFVWVGKEIDDIYSRFLATQVNSSGLQETMSFLGEVNSIEFVYAMADIFLLSSRLDPFPCVAIDAMLAGLPVVCFSNGSGVADMLSNCSGLKRLVVSYADAASAAEVIEQLSTDDCSYQAVKIATRDLAFSTFDMDRYVARLEQVAERAALIRMQENDDFTIISRSGALIAEYAAPPGFSGPRDNYVKSFVRESTACGDNRLPFPGFHPRIYRNANPELNDPPFVNPLAHYLRNGQPQGPWLLDIIRPEHATSVHDPLGSPTALHLHIHYPDLTAEMLRSLMANHQTRPDIFITVSSDEGLREVAETAAKLCLTIKDIMVVPNRGRDIGPLLTLLGRSLIKDYDIVGHLHAKRTASFPEPIGEVWRTFCVENLLGGKHAMMDLILDRFARNPKLGLVFPCDPNIIGWTLNRPPAEVLLERMGIAANLAEDFFFPVGTMFWARTDAIAPLLELHLSWNDYPPEPVPYDGTILHAIERLFPVVAQHRGFEIAGTYVPGVTR